MYAQYNLQGQKGIYETDIEKDIINKEYDGELTNNIVVIGQTGSGKTTYVENILENKFVTGDDLIWISSIRLLDTTRASYHARFRQFQNFAFYQVITSKDVNALLDDILPGISERYKTEKRKTIFVFDDLLNIADKADQYSLFLSTCRKSGIIAISVFQSFRNTDRWDNIKSNCPILVLFKLGTLTPRLIGQVAEIIVGRNEGVSKKRSWFYQLFINAVMNSSTFNHLLVDISPNSKYSPIGFRSNTSNPYNQLCYFDNGSHKSYITYRSIRVKKCGEDHKKRIFRISSVIYGKPQEDIDVHNIKERNRDFTDNKENGASSSGSNESMDEAERREHFFYLHKKRKGRKERKTSSNKNGKYQHRRYRSPSTTPSCTSNNSSSTNSDSDTSIRLRRRKRRGGGEGGGGRTRNSRNRTKTTPEYLI